MHDTYTTSYYSWSYFDTEHTPVPITTTTTTTTPVQTPGWGLVLLLITLVSITFLRRYNKKY